MQPLNVVVFQLFKHWYGKAVNQAYCTGAFKINKMEFLHLITDVQKRIFKKATIKAVFVETGLYLFNPKKVLTKLPLPRKATPEKDLQLITINIIILKTLKQASDLALYIRQNWQEQENKDLKADEKKLANKRKKQAKTPTPEPETPNNSRDEYSEWDEAREQQEDL